MLGIDTWGTKWPSDMHVQLAFKMIDELAQWFKSNSQSPQYVTSCVEGILAYWWSLDDIKITNEIQSSAEFKTLKAFVSTLQRGRGREGKGKGVHPGDISLGLDAMQRDRWNMIVKRF